jgi:c-di-AMP phosphodiesterase-like protein
MRRKGYFAYCRYFILLNIFLIFFKIVGFSSSTIKSLEYNKILKIYCKKNGHHYIDITKETLDTNSNTVQDNFLNNNPSDHHLDNEKTYILWLNKLRGILL